MGRGIPRPHRVDGAQAVGPAGDGSQGDCGDIRRVGREFGDDRDIHRGFHGGGDLAHQFRVLAHGHAVAAGVGAGEIEFQAVRYRRQNAGHCHELLDAAAKDGGEQESICRHLQLCHQLGGLLRPGVGQAHRVDEAARGVLAQYRLAITQPGLEADTLGGHYTHLGDVVKNVLDDRGGGGDDARGNGKRAGEGLAKEFCVQGKGLGVWVNGACRARVYRLAPL